VDAPTKLKHYEILSRLGEGGMGVVYSARDTRLGRTVALKMLPDELAGDEERIHRFEREARIVSRMSHPGIATLYDFDRDGAVAFLTMELVKGPTLRELLEDGPLATDRLLDCAFQVADALAAAHKGGVIHRDLKPENIMAGESGFYKVLDFGVARIEEPVGPVGTQTPTRTWATKAGSLIGTVSYMSPEQVLGQPTDARSDIFSFGSLLYELATGSPAFSKNSEVATAHAIVYEAPAPMPSSRVELPAGFDAVVQKCLTKDPDQRYARTTDLVHDLRAIRQGSVAGTRAIPELIAAPSAGRPRRSRLPLALLGVLLLAALSWGAFRWWPSSAPQAPAEPAPTAMPATAVESVAIERPRIVVAFFENNSGDASVDWISRGLPEMLTTDLSQSPDLDVIATQRLYDLMSGSGNDNPQVLDRSTTAELARWAGASVVISGSVFKVGPKFRIDAQAYRTDTGTVIVGDKVEGSDLLALIGDLTGRLLAGLSVEAQPQGHRATGSQEALQLFVRGKALYDNLLFPEAAAEFRRSLESDSEFSRARLHLAMSLYAADESKLAREALDETLAASDSLAESDRLLAQALNEYFADGDYAAGAALFEDLTRRFPSNGDGYVWWARGLGELEGEPLQASQKLRAAFDQDPNNLHAMVAMARQLGRVGQSEAATALLSEARERNPAAGPGIERVIDSLSR